MILEKMECDFTCMTVRSDAASWRAALREITSLLMASREFRLRKLRVLANRDCLDDIDPSIHASFRGNPLLEIGYIDERGGRGGDTDEGDICRRDDLVIVRSRMDGKQYRIEARGSGRCPGEVSSLAGILTCLLGFPGYMAFGARFCVYELLSNIVEYGMSGGEGGWITVTLDGSGETLTIRVRDPFREFNPVINKEFDLVKYLDSGMTRGLGLMMIQKMDHRMSYSRKEGFNETIISRVSAGDSAVEREDTMSSFTVSGPQTKDGLVHRVVLSGELDAKGALVLERAMSPLIGMKTVNVVLECRSVTFVSSAGVGMLLGLVSSIRRAGGEMVLREVSPEVRSVFSLLNLDDFFNLADAAGNRTHA